MLVVYFHGYGSSPKSNKVDALEQLPGVHVVAFKADVDPDIAYHDVGEQIFDVLCDDIHDPSPIVFVGTSLGAWLASKLATQFGVDAILINPSTDPATTLNKYGVPDEIASKYDRLVPRPDRDVFFFAEHDAVIDNVEFREKLSCEKYIIDGPDADHQFAGQAFAKVVRYIKEKYL